MGRTCTSKREPSLSICICIPVIYMKQHNADYNSLSISIFSQIKSYNNRCYTLLHICTVFLYVKHTLHTFLPLQSWHKISERSNFFLVAQEIHTNWISAYSGNTFKAFWTSPWWKLQQNKSRVKSLIRKTTISIELWWSHHSRANTTAQKKTNKYIYTIYIYI